MAKSKTTILLTPEQFARGTPPFDVLRAEQLAHDRVNYFRRQAGLRSLSLCPWLLPVARAHSDHQRKHGYLGHEGREPGCYTLDDRLRRAHISTNATRAENVANLVGEIILITPEEWAIECVGGLMESPGHRENILNPAFSHHAIGVAFANGRTILHGGQPLASITATQVFYKY